MSETLIIETTLLNSFVGEDSWVVVKARDGYARKKGRDLQIGDRVVVKNEGIDKTLEEVEPVLEESVRYRVARDTVYATSQRGRRVPVFRKLLLEGLADPDTENLEAKIFRDGADFTEQDYRGFRATLLSYVDVAESTAGAWLKGEVLAPRDWGQFAKLAPVHSGFQALADSYEQDIGFHDAYALYVGTRRTIMGYLAKRGKKQRTDTDHPIPPGTSGDEDNGGDSGGVGGNVTRGKYASEISLVVSRFMEEIDDTTSAARVTKILTCNGKKHGTPHEKPQPDPHLKRGILIEQIDHLAGPARSMNDLAREQYILQQALFDTCNLFYMRLIDETLGEEQELTQRGLTENTKLTFTLPTLTPYTVIQLLPHTTQFERTIFSVNRHGFMQLTAGQISEEELDGILKRAYEAFETHLRSGQIDAWLGTEPNTISTIIDYAREYASLLPKAHFDRVGVIGSLKYAEAKYMAMKNTPQKQGKAREIKRQEEQVRELAAKDRRLLAYLRETYGLRDDYSLHKSFFFSYHNDRLGLTGVRPDEVEAQSRDDLLRYKRQYEAAGKQFFTRTDVRMFLTQLGIPSAINLYEKRNWVVGSKDEEYQKILRQTFR